ncbi:MerR family transcriptional regulator [Halobacillus salinarum]|uniref:MerR family transcriptional regulator n=1 Tax=Halobacillus salinarum TaxID=2932257 RepID=A0ABY4EL32_9BACI|nr:MerR family transcriptional regulator [Halobacillus salinarum]UOQ44869.1 MerR family transcriptional regulator [Halobacillus salinarum]
MAKTIKQAAEELKIAADTIRYYDRVGLLPNLQRDNNGYRLFSDEDMYTLEMIKCFRATNMSIEDLTKIFAVQIDDPRFPLPNGLKSLPGSAKTCWNSGSKSMKRSRSPIIKSSAITKNLGSSLTSRLIFSIIMDD